ncbi:MAG: Rv3235 family protein [Actinobacteria bacterium]|jgi:hypothetical protein|nr:Rv3235 family protein [Actinomycetota bacterium]
MTTAALSPLQVVVAASGRPAAVSLDEAIEKSRRDRGDDGPFVQGALALELVPDEQLFGCQATSTSDLPDAREWAHRLGLAIAEIVVGLRPPTQVVRWTTPEVYAVLARRALVVTRRAATPALAAQPGRPGVPSARSRPRILVRRVHVCLPADGVAEAAVVLQDGPRVRAMALRLGGYDGRWRVEALQIG